jgi:hypothetical protein
MGRLAIDSKRFAIICVLLLSGLAWRPGAAWAGAPKSIPKTIPGGGVLKPDTKHLCPPGGYFLYVFRDGSSECLTPDRFPPRSPADCPPGTTYRVIHKWPVCDNPQEPMTLHHAGEPGSPPIYCKSDADCPRGGVCYPGAFGYNTCGSPGPISR